MLSTVYGIVEQRFELHVRPLPSPDGLLNGPAQIAGYLVGDQRMAAQVERLITAGELPYFRLNGVAHATKSSLQRFADRTFAGHNSVQVYCRSRPRARIYRREAAQSLTSGAHQERESAEASL
jgi:hypothetical protein